MRREGGYTGARMIPADPAAVIVEIHGCKHSITVEEALELRRWLYDAIYAAQVENIEHGHPNNKRKFWWQGWRRK